MLERLQIEEHSILPASDCLLLAAHPCPSPPATPTGVPGSCTNHPPPRSQLQTPHALSAGLPGGEAEGVGGGRRHHPAMGKMESSPHPAEALLLVLGRHVHASPLPPVLSGTPLPSPDQTTNLLLHQVHLQNQHEHLPPMVLALSLAAVWSSSPGSSCTWR